MQQDNLVRNCGILCIIGSVVAAGLAVLAGTYPDGVFVDGEFAVPVPWLHRLEHALFALIVYPGIFCGLYGYYASGAVGRRIFGKLVPVFAFLGLVLAVSGALVQVVVLQSDAADVLRGVGFHLFTLFLAPLIGGVIALMQGIVPLWKRLWPLVLAALLIAMLILQARVMQGWPMAMVMMAWAVLGYSVYLEGSRDRSSAP